jgi:hypothetical protein
MVSRGAVYPHMKKCVHSNLQVPSRLLLRIHPHGAHIQTVALLLEELINMLLLEDERQAEVLDVEGEFRVVEQTEHVQLLRNLLHTTLQLADTRLLLRMRLKDMSDDLLADAHTLQQIDLLQCLREQELLGNLELLLGLVALKLDNHEAVEQDTVNLVDIVRTEHEHGLA